jgi:hypothetical protein
LKLLEYEVELRRADGTAAYAIMMGPPALTKGQRVRIRLSDREWAQAEIVNVSSIANRSPPINHRVVAKEVANSP